jgi:cholesterol oxidase
VVPEDAGHAGGQPDAQRHLQLAAVHPFADLGLAHGGGRVRHRPDLPLRVESWQLLGAHSLPVIMTLTMTADTDNRGTFTYDPLTKTVSLSDWSAAKSQQAADASAAYNQSVINANPGTVPYSLTWPFTLTAHPLGGCVLGTSTDLAGRVKGYRGLYALDGSLIPGNIGGANPSLTIAAIAERAMFQIIAAGG